MTIAPTKRVGLSVLPCAYVSNRKEERRELLTARGDSIRFARHAIRSFGSGYWRAGSFGSLRARMVGTKRDAVLRIPIWGVALHKPLGQDQWVVRLVQHSICPQPDWLRWHDATSTDRTPSSQSKSESVGLSWSGVARYWLRKQRNALGTGRDSQRLMRSSAISALRWRFISMESASSTFRQGVLRESLSISWTRRLACLRVVGQRDESRLRFWQRIMGSNKASSGCDSALRSRRSRSWKWRSRRTRGRCVQQWMVPLE